MKKECPIWLACLTAGRLMAAQPDPDTNFENYLRRVPAAELPAMAALLVERTQLRQRSAVAREVVRVATRINPAATVAVVYSVSRQDPLSAVESAMGEQPQQATAIARAAAGAAPARAGDIVMRVAELAPEQWRGIARAASRAAPDSGRLIILAVARLRTELSPYLELELAQLRARRVDVATCLDRAEMARQRAAAAPELRKNSKDFMPRPPRHTPPRGEPDPPGGRNYARP